MSNKITSDISFCDKTFQNVICDDVKNNILNKLTDDYEVCINKKGFVLIQEKYYPNLKKNQHVMTIKSNGNSYYLFLTKYNNINTCFYIDKKIKQGFQFPRILLLKQRFSEDIFNDTLIEGELVRKENNKWIFLISDLHVYKGIKINSNIIDKYNTIYNILTNEYIPDIYLDPCQYQVKKIFNYEKINDLLNDFIPQLPYNVKGIIFHPINKKYNNLFYMLKNNNHKKESVKIGIDNKKNDGLKDIKQQVLQSIKNINIDNINNIIIRFKIIHTENPDIFNLHILNNNNYIFYDIANVQTLKTSKLVKKIFKENNEKDIIVNCKYSLKFKKWEPISLSESKEPHSFMEFKKLCC